MDQMLSTRRGASPRMTSSNGFLDPAF